MPDLIIESSRDSVLQITDPQEKHFATGHLLANLRSRTLSSGIVTLAAQGIQLALTLASTMVLARLLSPQDFGLVAMVMTVMGFLRIFKDAGLSTATVQREGITHAQVSNLFWINVAVSGLMSLLVAAAAPLIARFYREPQLVGVTMVLSITFLLTGLSVQHLALLNRQMRFKAVAVIQVISMLAGVLAGIGMAWFDCGYWSLVGMNVIMAATTLLLTWKMSRWRPQFFARRSGTRPMLNFGVNLTAGGFIYSLARESDGLMIGRFYGAAAIGLYSRANALLMRPLQQFICPIESVFMPVLSRLQAQPERYRRTFLQFYEATALASFLVTGLFLALAHPLTLVILGRKWEQAAIIFAVFTFAALQYPLSTTASWLFASQARGKDSLLASLIISVVVVASFAAGLPFGPAGVAIVYSASCLLIQLPILYYIAGRSGPVSSADLWIGFLRHLPLWVVVCGATWLTNVWVANAAPLMQLLVCAPAGLLAGAVFICIYPPTRRVAVSLLSIFQELIKPAPHQPEPFV